MNILILILILLSIDFIFLFSARLKGRSNKKKYLPITSIDMNEKQYEYVMKRLKFQMKFSQPAFLFYNAVQDGLLKDEDLPNLNEYLQETGLYIGKFKIY